MATEKSIPHVIMDGNNKYVTSTIFTRKKITFEKKKWNTKISTIEITTSLWNYFPLLSAKKLHSQLLLAPFISMTPTFVHNFVFHSSMIPEISHKLWAFHTWFLIDTLNWNRSGNRKRMSHRFCLMWKGKDLVGRELPQKWATRKNRRNQR